MTGQPNASLACRRARNLGPWFFAFWLFLAACGFGAPVSQDAQTVARTDIGGRLTRIDRPNGTWRKMIYDAAGQLRLAEEHEPGVNGALIWLQNLRYDKVGSDFNVNENDGEITWTFTAPTPAGFSLPADTATYDADNQEIREEAKGGGSKRVRAFFVIF
ncbi:MAG: hypothetical protein K0R17_2354 [Rariglobus sp.]|nr:hypothetical protein [Rariglobus sp.]